MRNSNHEIGWSRLMRAAQLFWSDVATTQHQRDRLTFPSWSQLYCCGQRRCACTLGGPDGRTLYIVTADWHMQESFESNLDRLLSTQTGQILTHPAPTPPDGWPGSPATSHSSR